MLAQMAVVARERHHLPEDGEAEVMAHGGIATS